MGVLLSGFTAARAAGDNYPVGARAAGMGDCGLTSKHTGALWQNQGALGFFQHPAVSLHHENRFLVPELALSSSGLTLPVPGGTLGLSFARFGYSLHHEDKIGLAFGKAFNNRFGAGIQISYLGVLSGLKDGGLNPTLNGYRVRSGALAIEAGILVEISEGLLIGVHIFNPAAAKHSGVGGPVPVIFRIGLGYHFSDRLMMAVETEKDLSVWKSVFRAGSEYRLIEYIYLRTGLSIQEYVQHSFGFSFSRNSFEADLAFTFHQVLGCTPSLSLSYAFR